MNLQGDWLQVLVVRCISEGIFSVLFHAVEGNVFLEGILQVIIPPNFVIIGSK